MESHDKLMREFESGMRWRGKQVEKNRDTGNPFLYKLKETHNVYYQVKEAKTSRFCVPLRDCTLSATALLPLGKTASLVAFLASNKNINGYYVVKYNVNGNVDSNGWYSIDVRDVGESMNRNPERIIKLPNIENERFVQIGQNEMKIVPDFGRIYE